MFWQSLLLSPEMSSKIQPSSDATMSQVTLNASVLARPPTADAPRRPAPIQTANLQTTQPPQARSTPGEQHAGDDFVLERPPISPITPTEEDSPASRPAHSQAQPPTTHSQVEPSESRPLSRTSFTFIAPRHATTPPRPLSQRSGSHPTHTTGSSDSNSATPPRPPSSATHQPHQPYQFGAAAATAHAAQPQAAHTPSSTVPPATFMPQPPAQPLDEAANTDVAALKACISVLQLQQAKSRKDIAALQHLKGSATADPAGFTAALQSGRLIDSNAATAAADPLAATFAGADDESASEDEDEEMHDAGADANAVEPKFGTIPQPQNVVRCPPINWAKYQIVGEPLDRMHEEQRRRPDPGEPWREGPREAVVFAPYSPFRDQLGMQHQQQQQQHQQGMVTRKGGKRPG